MKAAKFGLFLFGVLFFMNFIDAAIEHNEATDKLVENKIREFVIREAGPKTKKKKAKENQRKSKTSSKKLKRKRNKKEKKGGERGRKSKKQNKLRQDGKKGIKKKSKKNNSANRKTKKKETGKRKNSVKQERKTLRSSPITEKCYNTSLFYMKQVQTLAINFDKQYKRMKAQKKTAMNKEMKKGIFKEIASTIQLAGGGNKDKLDCGGSTTNKGAKQLKNLTDFLSDCDSSINKTCNKDTFPKINMTLLGECNTTMPKFVEGVKKCRTESPSMACKCWEDKELEKYSNFIKKCVFKKEAEMVKKQLDKCKEAFGKCRKYQDDAGPAIAACSKSEKDLKKTAATLKNNKNALEEAKKKLKEKSGSSGRRVRAVPKTCKELLDQTKTLNTLATTDPSNSSIATLAKDIAATPPSVTCTDAEKAEINKEITAMDAAIKAVEEAFDAVQESLKDLTGSTASAASLTTVPSSATSASSGRRERLVKDLMKNII